MKIILKKLYDIIPFKKELYIIIKKIYKHLHFVGNIKIDVDKNKSFKIRHYGYQLENELFWNGVKNGWEKHSVQLWMELCKYSETIFDIGANTGVYALLAKTINKKANVFAFEPVERVFEKLTHNVQLNNYNITCIKKAISNYDGYATIFDKNTAHTYSVTVNKDLSNNPESSIPVEIETIKIDTYIRQNGLSKIDLLKIDVETHEVEVLEGFKEHIKKYKPTLLIEILNDEVANGLQNLISDIDYVFFNIDENHGVKRVSKLSKSDYYNFLICKPEVAKKLNTLKMFQTNTQNII